jgi:CDP-diacylglycerol--glycerol-3-phosphate 3-phosphatidyltransferase
MTAAGPAKLFQLRNLPNLITFFRILLVPVLVVLLEHPGRAASIAAAFTFHLACWSDFFDGYLARRHGITTTLGKLLDPLADKLIVMTALVMLAAMPREPRIPAWIVVLPSETVLTTRLGNCCGGNDVTVIWTGLDVLSLSLLSVPFAFGTRFQPTISKLEPLSNRMTILSLPLRSGVRRRLAPACS